MGETGVLISTKFFADGQLFRHSNFLGIEYLNSDNIWISKVKSSNMLSIEISNNSLLSVMINFHSLYDPDFNYEFYHVLKIFHIVYQI